MIPERAPDENPLDQDASQQPADEPGIKEWFLDEQARGNPATDLRVFTTGNEVIPLIDGRSYFRRLHEELTATAAGDQVYFADFRGDMDELLDGPGTAVGQVFIEAARRGVAVFGLLWRSHPKWLHQSEEANAEFAREISDNGGHVLLDARTRRAGSHHQKLVVIRHPKERDRDVAFVGGIDLGFSRGDDSDHGGDPQVMPFPDAYGPRPGWHDIQAEVHGPAVHDLEHTFRERWYGSSKLDMPSPLRMLYDRAYHAGAMTGRPLPEPLPDDERTVGTKSVQVLRTYPARLRRYPFAPHGERSIAHAYRKAFTRARRLVYLEDQYLWSAGVAEVIGDALESNDQLRVVVIVPRHSDHSGRVKTPPAHFGRQEALRLCGRAGGDRFQVYDLENDAGTPVYVHAKVVVIDDVWAMIGSDNLNRRSWTHDSELSIAVLDRMPDKRPPLDPAELGDCARVFARDLRLRLMTEHLGRKNDDVDDLIDPDDAAAAVAASAAELQTWYAGGRQGARPSGRLLPHEPPGLSRLDRAWARPVYKALYDPDGSAWRDRLRRRG